MVTYKNNLKEEIPDLSKQSQVSQLSAMLAVDAKTTFTIRFHSRLVSLSTNLLYLKL